MTFQNPAFRRCLVLVVLLVSLTCISCQPEKSADIQTLAPEPATHFYFVQITDTHLGTYDHKQRLERIIEGINKLPMPIEFVVVTGDLFADNILTPGLAEESRELFERADPPVHYLPGNHDIDPRDLDNTVGAYREHFGELYTSAEYKNVRCLFLYTEPLRRTFAWPGVDPLEWLDQQLSLAPGQPTLVFHHAPSTDDFYKGRYHDNWNPKNREKWTALVNSANVKAVVTGHFHRPELHWAGDVPVYVSTAVASYWKRSPTYRIYEYRDGKLGYITEYMN